MAEKMCACGHAATAHIIKVGVLGELMVGCAEPDCYCRHYHQRALGRPWLAVSTGASFSLPAW